MDYLSTSVEVDDTHIHMVTCGKGRPVILLHGLTNNWESHIPIASILSNHYSVIILDLPGYGDSGTLPGYNLQIMATYLRRFIEKMNIQPVSLVGLSMGGFVTAEFAKMYPQYTTSSVIIGPVLNDKGYKVDMLKYLLKSADAIPAGPYILKKIIETQTHAYFFAKHFNMHRFDKQLVDLYGRNGNKKMTKDAYIDMGISLAEYNTDLTLLNLQVPTLLIYGKHDRISGPTYANRHIMPKNPFLRMNVIEEAGHWVSVEKPQDTASAIVSFLQKYT